MVYLVHGKTKENRFSFGSPSPSGGYSHTRYSGIADGPGRFITRPRKNDLGSNRHRIRDRQSDGGAVTDSLSATERNDPSGAPTLGGRRRALLSWEQENAFLADWQTQAEHGELVVLTPLRTALEKKLGRQVKASVVYRLVERHRWRKVAPDTRHPKADPSVQDEWKKKLYPKSWRPC
jgi:transposase